MANDPYVRSTLAHVALELVPPLIRQSLMDDPGFRSDFGLRTAAVIDFGDAGVSVDRTKFFDAVRKALSRATATEVTDLEGRNWHLNRKNKTNALPALAMFHGDRRLDLPDLNVLSPQKATRLRSLDEAASEVNLPPSDRRAWRDILSERALDDDEVDEFNRDLLDTPVNLSRVIHSELTKGKAKISTLVPSSRRYFERLVGRYDGSASITDYSGGGGKQILEHLREWHPYDGFLFSLFLASHSSLAAEITVDQLKDDDLSRVLDFLEKCGDIISQLGAVEVGLRMIPEKPGIEGALIRLIEQIRDDNVDGANSGFKLLSALFVLVDGELATTRLLSVEPPFYRRLASLTQAALIHRQYINTDLTLDSFCDWAFEARGGQYHLQTLADLRLEPRWTPNFASPSQMQADFYGRIMITAKNYERNIRGGKLHALALGTGDRSLPSLSEFFRPYLPGPLEGGGLSPNPLPAEYSDAIAAQLSTGEADVSSFIALVNTAQVFRIETEQAQAAANLLKSNDYRISGVEDKAELLYVLNGLAKVAAVTRSCTLADELRILVRRFMRGAQSRLSIEDAFRFCLVAAASRSDLHEWREFTGDWLTELAFGELKDDEATVLHQSLQGLCHAVPELWVSCGRADAALEAFCAV